MAGIDHEITVAQLKVLLAQLRDDDVLIPNTVANLAIRRDGTYVGFVDLLKDQGQIELFGGA